MEGMLIALQKVKKTGFSPQAILDIGAYQGEWTKAAAVTFEQSQILMLEAQESMEPTLAAFHGYDASRFQYEIALLGAEGGQEREFHIVESEWGTTGSSMFPELTDFPSRTTKRVTRTIDAIIAERGFPGADLIKVDVQGAELEVLRGALEALKQAEFVCLELSTMEYNQGVPRAGEVIKFMVEHGFEIFDCFDSRFDSAGNHVQMDMTFIKANSKFQPTLQIERVDVSAA